MHRTTMANQAHVNPEEKMAQLLLSGWIMLQDSCRTCNCPLFSSKDRKVIKCAVCLPPSAPSPQPTAEKVEKDDISEAVDDICNDLIDSIKTITESLEGSSTSSKDCIERHSMKLDLLNKYADVLIKFRTLSQSTPA